MKKIIRLNPAFKDYLWGGNRMRGRFGFSFDAPCIAEAWVLSAHPDGASLLPGENNMTFPAWLEREGEAVAGRHCAGKRDFPVLVKLIDAMDDLSIQVHPDDAYARKYENSAGKTEFWYVLEAEPGARLFCGFEKEVSKEEFVSRIEQETLPEILHSVPVKKGDSFLISPGTIHAIGKGILLAEIQQNSNVTYRVYDYGRRGADGKKRELHVDKALAVTKLCPADFGKPDEGHLVSTDYFTVDLVKSGSDGIRGRAGEDSFVHVLVLSGSGRLQCGGEEEALSPGTSLFLPAGSGDFMLTKGCEALLTTV